MKTTNKADTSKRAWIYGIRRLARISRKLETNGISLKAKSHKRYSNFTMTSNGYIDNADVETLPARWELSGDTYHVRGLAKNAGFTWDGQRKVWFAPLATEIDGLGAAILRSLAS